MDRSIWIENVLVAMEDIGEEGREAVTYLRKHKTPIGFWKVRKNIGAFWTIFGTVHLNTRHFTLETKHADPRVTTLLIHEVKHLQQGFVTALSVYGELEAWQLQFGLYHRITNMNMHKAIAEMMSLPLGWDRKVLQRARELMQEYAGKGYRADLLPLYPLGKEIRYRLLKQIPA